jgi:hypothetical protein
VIAASSVSGATNTSHRFPTPLVREEIVALIWAAAGRVRVPVKAWSMQAAIETLEAQVSRLGRLGQSLAMWPSATTSAGSCRPDLGLILLRLAKAGDLSLEGSRWDAGFRPLPFWIDRGESILAGLSADDRRAVGRAAQTLVASVTSWSKNARASLPSRSATS